MINDLKCIDVQARKKVRSDDSMVVYPAACAVALAGRAALSHRSRRAATNGRRSTALLPSVANVPHLTAELSYKSATRQQIPRQASGHWALCVYVV